MSEIVPDFCDSCGSPLGDDDIIGSGRIGRRIVFLCLPCYEKFDEKAGEVK